MASLVPIPGRPPARNCACCRFVFVKALSGIIRLLDRPLDEGDLDAIKKMLLEKGKAVSVWDALTRLCL